jgi:hypothetical protein
MVTLVKTPRILVSGESIAIRGSKGEFINTIKASGKIAAADFDGDGEDDIVVNVAGQVSLHKMDGTNLFSFAAEQAGITTGDYDGNGTPEFLTAAAHTVTVYDFEGKLLKTVDVASLGETADIRAVAADVTGDKIVDIVAGDAKSNQVAVYSIDGTKVSTFNVFQTLAKTEPTTATTDSTTTEPTAATADSTTTEPTTATTGSTTTEPTTATTDSTATEPTAATTDSTTTEPTVATTDSTATEPTTASTDSTATDSKKTTVCHGGKTLSIATSALKAHLAHGDTEGQCATSADSGSDSTSAPDTTTSTDTTPTTTTETATDSTSTTDATTAPETTEVVGVNVAAGDVDGDGQAEIIAAMASGGSTVEVYRADGTLVTSFAAFDSNSGVAVATGDADNNGTVDIVVGQVGGTEVRVFSLENGAATQIVSFTASEQGNIQSIAVATQLTDGTPTAPEDGVVVTAAPETTDSTSTDSTTTTETISNVAAPTCQMTTDGLNGSCNGGGQTITNDVTITEELSVANVSVDSDVVNDGLLSNATVQEEATVTGGKLSGDILNKGVIVDITFGGRILKGGTLKGKIAITAPVSLRLGIVENVTLAAGTQLSGGKLQGTITGTAEDPALIENAEVADGAELSNVILGEGVVLGEDVTLTNVTQQ